MADETEMSGGKRSAWMTHVKKTMKANKGKPLSAVLKMAKKTYKKSMKGGAGLSPMTLETAPTATQKAGRRRRGKKSAKKTRKH